MLPLEINPLLLLLFFKNLHTFVQIPFCNEYGSSLRLKCGQNRSNIEEQFTVINSPYILYLACLWTVGNGAKPKLTRELNPGPLAEATLLTTEPHNRSINCISLKKYIRILYEATCFVVFMLIKEQVFFSDYKFKNVLKLPTLRFKAFNELSLQFMSSGDIPKQLWIFGLSQV